MHQHREHIKNSTKIQHHDLILVSDVKWYKDIKPDNMGLSCVHKFTAKTFDCVKAFYQCKTCTNATAGNDSNT